MARKDRAAHVRALKSCVTMCGDQASAFVAEAEMEDVTEGRHYSSDFRMPDGTELQVYLHVVVRPAVPKRKPVMIEGAKS